MTDDANSSSDDASVNPAAADIPGTTYPSDTDTDTDVDVTDTTDDAGAPVAAVARRRSALPVLAIVAAVVVVADQLTKHWALNALSGTPPRHAFWTLQWNLTFNSGMAFSRGQNMGPVIGLLALAVVVFVVLNVRTSNSRLVTVAAGCVVGGALGNVVDRLFRGDAWLHGSVVDFIDFQWFPIFNIADIAVNVGGGLFVIWSLFTPHEATS